MKKQLYIDIIAAALILLFLYTGFSKIFDFWYFKYDLSKQPFPVWLQEILSWLIPSVELLISALLMFSSTKRKGFILAIVLMAFFTGYTIAILLHVFPFVPCGCGGVIRTLTWPQHLIFNLFIDTLIVIALVLYHEAAKKPISKKIVGRTIKYFTRANSG